MSSFDAEIKGIVAYNAMKHKYFDTELYIIKSIKEHGTADDCNHSLAFSL